MPAKLTYLSDRAADPALLPHWLTLGRLTLPGHPRLVREARRFVAGTIGTEHRQYDTAVLLTSELVTNAITHSQSGWPGGTLDLTIAASCSALLFSVTDQGSTAGEPAALPAMAAAPGGTHGNGLVLVDSLSDGWGYRHDGGRTSVWFRLRALGGGLAGDGLATRGSVTRGSATRAALAPAGVGPLVPQPHRQVHRGALESELLTQPALDEPAIAGLQETRREQHDVRRPHSGLSGEHDLRLLAAADRRRGRGDQRG